MQAKFSYKSRIQKKKTISSLYNSSWEKSLLQVFTIGREINWMHHTWAWGSFASKSLTLSSHLNSLTATKPLEVELQIDAITPVNVSNFLYHLAFKMNRRFTQSQQTKKKVCNMTEINKNTFRTRQWFLWRKKCESLHTTKENKGYQRLLRIH